MPTSTPAPDTKENPPAYPRIRYRAKCPQPRDSVQHMSNARAFAAAAQAMMASYNFQMAEEPGASVAVFLAIKDSLNAAARELDRACEALMFDPEGHANA
ncbi:hypothetical protein [Methylosinus sp. Sm6]|uniref:hypothetical protein n=1 Tax=Methylosinus sp. Sm6 TaxID=2866948 RepID=UPI001C9A0205|nr:hypothetical protein [Methylosinus sp. Sm6]MBY6239841.1 hypothetical protein [Methylosinus sp. Sm6]